MTFARAAPACALALAAAVLVAAAPPSAPSPRGREVVEEDAARAFAAARERGALVLVDVWAPW